MSRSLCDSISGLKHTLSENVKAKERIKKKQAVIEAQKNECSRWDTRSTKNPSGGESFIVNLSLALGLSQMASRKVRVDSLFLDEGFGTLDDDALDTALETLTALQQDGKLIGVISHMLALKERISTQIQVTPQTGGRSLILGPRCARLDKS
ncbi:MAG: hypothetical protein GX562_00720 [Coriobacteriaceae bacterium]|nr:hypothetical protein [Coriobacteriaceae bacterium]